LCLGFGFIGFGLGF